MSLCKSIQYSFQIHFKNINSKLHVWFDENMGIVWYEMMTAILESMLDPLSSERNIL
jgi:hypothetical protein